MAGIHFVYKSVHFAAFRTTARLLASSQAQNCSLRFSSNVPGGLEVGRREEVQKVFSQADVQNFVGLSGDDNPIHLDYEYAKETKFGRPIIHGVLLLGPFSGLLYHKIGGSGAVLVSLSSAFKSPAFVDEKLVMSATVSETRRRIVKLDLLCEAVERSQVILTGEAIVLTPQN